MKKSENKTSITKEAVTLAQVEERLVTIRNQNVLLDRDVAALYAVETREVNQALQRNPGKFPEGYVIQLDKTEWQNDDHISRSQIVTLKKTRRSFHFNYAHDVWKAG